VIPAIFFRGRPFVGTAATCGITTAGSTGARAGIDRATTVRALFTGSGAGFAFALMTGFITGADLAAIFGLFTTAFAAIAFFTTFGDDAFLFDDLATKTLANAGHPDYKTKERQV
jgi:hypothetical protein